MDLIPNHSPKDGDNMVMRGNLTHHNFTISVHIFFYACAGEKYLKNPSEGEACHPCPTLTCLKMGCAFPIVASYMLSIC